MEMGGGGGGKFFLRLRFARGVVPSAENGGRVSPIGASWASEEPPDVNFLGEQIGLE